jgi:hypothetical protein
MSRHGAGLRADALVHPLWASLVRASAEELRTHGSNGRAALTPQPTGALPPRPQRSRRRLGSEGGVRPHSPALLAQPYWGWRTLGSRDDGRMTVRRALGSDAPSYTGSCPTGQLTFTSAACPPKPWPDRQQCKTTDNTRGAGVKSSTALMVRALQCCSVARRDSMPLFFAAQTRARQHQPSDQRDAPTLILSINTSTLSRSSTP